MDNSDILIDGISVLAGRETLTNFLCKAMKRDNEKIIANANTFLARIAMYEEDMQSVNKWLETAPNEDL